jgi:hypothetical protein
MAYHLDDYSAGGDTVGPVDFLVLEFPGTDFNGEIMRNLADLVAAGTIRIIDLVVVAKSKYGSVATMEMQELHEDVTDALAPLQATISELITRDDLAAIADKLVNDSTAAVMLFENVWAVKTMQAMLKANGRVLAHERIPHEVVAEAIEDIASMRIAEAA